MTAGHLPPWGAGLQNERTTLAWSRTTLSLVGVGLFLARETGSITAALAILAVVALAAGALLRGADRRHHHRGGRSSAEGQVLALVPVAVTSAVVAALAAGALVLVIS